MPRDGTIANPLDADRRRRLDAFIHREMRRQMIPGLSLAVARSGRLVEATGYGLANLEHRVPATEATVYQSASIGKTFTAAAVMSLVEAGAVRLEDPITRHLGVEVAAWEGVTVHHLLSHTSGIPDYLERIDFRRDHTEPELVELLAGFALSFAPGEEKSYSNSGYVLLGILVHRVTGRPYLDFLRERIFDPLGMSTARGITESELVADRAAGYRLEDGEWKNQRWVAPSLNHLADGGLYLTVLDLVRWDAALYGEVVLEQSTLERMWSPTELPSGQPARYGLGWQIHRHNGHRHVGHSGGWQGFSTQLMRFLDEELTVVVLTNRGGASADAIALGVAAVFEPDLEVRTPDPVSVPPSALEGLAGRYALGPRTLEVRLENGALRLSTPHERVRLSAASETLFFTADGGWVRFHRDRSGRVQRMVAFGVEAKRLQRPR